MPKTLRQKLEEKNWTKEEIDKALGILYSKEKQEKHMIFPKFMSPVVYWVALIVAIIGNLMISIVLIPFLLVLTHLQLYIVIIVLGASFGAFFNLIIRDIEHVDYHHHIIAGVFIPTLAVINIYIIVTLANRIGTELIKTNITQNAVYVSVVYVIAFIMPYLFYKIPDLRQERRLKTGKRAKAAA